MLMYHLQLVKSTKYKVLSNPLTDGLLILDDNYSLFTFDALIAKYWEEVK